MMSRKPTPEDRTCNNGKGDKLKKKKGRGPARHVDPPNVESDRPILTIEGMRFRRDPYKKDENISRLIGQIVRTNYPGGGTSSYKRDWDSEQKTSCFHEFTRRYKFSDNVRIKDAEELFHIKANRALSQSLYEARKQAIKDSGSENPQEWIDFRPHWIQRQAWKLLISEFCDEYFKSLSERNASNRVASEDQAFATTGSLSILDYKYKMMEDNGGCEPDMVDVFVRTHTKQKTCELVSNKAKKTKEAVQEARKRKYGDDSTDTPPWDMELWADATGGMPHGHSYGMGGAVDSRVKRCSSHPSIVPTQTQPPAGYLHADEVKELLKKEREEALKREAEIVQRCREEGAEEAARRERRYLRSLQRAMRDSRRMIMQEMLGRRNDGASTSRQIADDRYGQNIKIPNAHNASIAGGASHHRSNWCNSSDVDSSSDEEYCVPESSGDEQY